ncbi:MAG: NAD-dependent epimerase/dehydratase family protein [Pyrinomonadaceae bacterium]
MKTLITGGSGYLGTHLRRHFGADDLSRRSGLNILNGEDVAMVSEYDVVIHLAACLDKSSEATEEVFLTNVEGTVNVLKNVRRDAVFIFASTKDVYGRFADNFAEVTEECPTLYSGQSVLEWSKLIAERYVEYYSGQNNFRSCIFRLSNVYAPATEGNTSGFVAAVVDAVNKGESIQLPGRGKPIRDFLHVDDFAAACEAFRESVIRRGLYNLGGGASNSVSLTDLVEKVEEVSGLQAAVDGRDPLPDPVPFKYISSLNRVWQELGWRPAIDLETGIRTLI